MPVETITIGPFSSITVNGSPISNIRTGGSSVTEVIPDQYFPCLNNSATVDWHTVSFSLTFYNPNRFVMNLARGQVPNTSLNSPPDQQIYSMTLGGLNQSYTFPTIRTVKRLDVNQNKDRATQITINFIAQNRNPDVSLIQFSPN